MLRSSVSQPRMVRSAKVFLGGTCMGTDWREYVKERIHCDYFDPHVKDREWTEDDHANELDERKHVCTHTVYVISPAGVGLYGVAEAVEDSILNPSTTLVCFLKEGHVSNESHQDPTHSDDIDDGGVADDDDAGDVGDAVDDTKQGGEQWSERQLASIDATAELIKNYHHNVVYSLDDVVHHINSIA